jgi:uncharacterized protein YjcR
MLECACRLLPAILCNPSAEAFKGGKPCQNPVVRGWKVCRHHGAGGGAPKGNRNAWKHGRYSAEALVMNQTVRSIQNEFQALQTILGAPGML